jgi:hypothetical protein
MKEITDGSDPVVSTLSRYGTDQLGIVQSADLIEAALKDAGYLYSMDINPRQVGFDPSNRDATGCNVQEVLLLASDIVFVGFSWAETSHALCIETLPGDDSVEQFNRMISPGLHPLP